MEFKKVLTKDVPSYRQLCDNETRPFTYFLQSLNKQDLVGVEIGTYKGLNAVSILKELNIKKLYLVDPYVNFNDKVLKVDKTTYEIAKKNLRKMSNYEFVIKTSKDSINYIPNNLDFVYIDGNHDYEYVKEDIELWYPKVKKCGVLGGNDFDAGHFGVVRAVLEFVTKKDIDLYGDIFDWWFLQRNSKIVWLESDRTGIKSLYTREG